MIDYFDALLRSAGVGAAASPAHPAPMAPAGVVEQQIDVEIGATSGSPATASSTDAAATGREPAPRASTRPFAKPPAELRRDPASGLLQRPALDDEVHPAVRAALEWVGADPEPVASGTPTSRPATDRSSTERSPSPITPPAPPELSTGAQAVTAAQPAAAARPLPAPASFPIEHEIEREAERQPAWSPPSSIRDRQLAVPRTAPMRQDVVAGLDEANRVPPESIEVHIGSIHVRVDAPPALRTVAPPAPPPSGPPAPARSADRGSFGRSRLPRI